MLEVIKLFGELLWAILSASFSLYKQIVGMRNNLIASLIGVSPVLITIISLAVSGIKKIRL